MTTQTEALKLALEAFTIVRFCVPPAQRPTIERAITAIKEALAQPEQEKDRCVGCEACIDTACGRDECPKGWPKASQPEQEPAAVVETIGGYPDESAHVAKWLVPYKSLKAGDKLYIEAPQRTWVGLTELENAEFVKTMERGNFLVAIYDIEKKLKEKNI